MEYGSEESRLQGRRPTMKRLSLVQMCHLHLSPQGAVLRQMTMSLVTTGADQGAD